MDKNISDVVISHLDSILDFLSNWWKKYLKTTSWWMHSLLVCGNLTKDCCFFFFFASVCLVKPQTTCRWQKHFYLQVPHICVVLMSASCRSAVGSFDLCHTPSCSFLYLLQHTTTSSSDVSHATQLKSGFCNIISIAIFIYFQWAMTYDWQ